MNTARSAQQTTTGVSLMRSAWVMLEVVAALVAVLAIVVCWPLRLDLSIKRDSAIARATARVSPWPFFASVPFYSRDFRVPASLGAQPSLSSLGESLARLRRMVRMIVSAASRGYRLIELTWHSSVGTGNAASTAVICGQLWAIKSILAAWAYSRWGRGRLPPDLSVSPAFDRAQFTTVFHVVVETAIGPLLGNPGLRAAVSSLAAAKGKRPANEQAAGHEY